MNDVVLLEKLKFSPTHEWVEIDGNQAVIGISHYAAELLGDIVFIELPELHQPVDLGSACGVIESVKAATDFCLPLSGEIVAVNVALEEQPELVNQCPYSRGWLVKIAMSEPVQQQALIDYEQYLKTTAARS